MKRRSAFVFLAVFHFFSFSTWAAPTAEQQILNVWREQANDPWVAQWLNEQLTDPLRDGLDGRVWKVLHAHPIARQVMLNVTHKLTELVSHQRMAHMSNAALAVEGKNGQLQSELKRFKALARKMAFSQAAIDDAHLFVSNGPVNAYTYSPLLSKLDVMLYSDLSDKLSPEQLDAVIAHELGHIAGRHVLMNIVVQTVFKATGQILIPVDKIDLFNAMILKEGSSVVASSLHHARTNEKLVEKIMNLITDEATQLLNDQTRLRPELVSLSHDLVKTVSPREVKRLDEQGEDPLAKTKIYKSAITLLQRSQETTADRIAIVTVGFEPFIGAMAKLAGDRHASVQAIVAQGERLVTQMGLAGLSIADVSDGDHPPTVLRAIQHQSFMTTQPFRVATDPVLQAFVVYLNLTALLDHAEAQIEASHGEIFDLVVVQIRREKFTQLAKELGATLQQIILREITDKTLPPEQAIASISKIIDFMDRVREGVAQASDSVSDRPGVRESYFRMRELYELLANPDLGRPGRLVYELVAALVQTGQPDAIQAAKMLASRIQISRTASEKSDLFAKAKALRCEDVVRDGSSEQSQ